MYTLPTELTLLAAEVAARHPLPLSVAADVAAVTALIVDVGPPVAALTVMFPEPELQLAA